MKGSANRFAHLFLRLYTSHLAAAPDSSVGRLYIKDNSLYMRTLSDIILIGPQTLSSGSFLDLGDTPSDYSGQGLKLLRVNSGEDAVEFSNTIIPYLPDTSGKEQQFLKLDSSLNLEWGVPTQNSVSFLDLTDTPNTYAGSEFQGLVRVNVTTNGLEFIAAEAAIPQQARVGVRKNSTGSTSIRRRLNFIEGSNVSITVSDDAGDEEVDITISATTSSSTPTMTRANSSSLEASRVLKSTSGSLRLVFGYNSGSEQYIQLHDATSLPANGATPAAVIKVPATKSFSIGCDDGIPFTNGIVICNSSTSNTKTIGSADCYFTGIFE